MSRYLCPLLLTSTLAIGVGSAARAQKAAVEAESPDDKARELFLAGQQAYAEGRYEEAAKLFEEALELSPKPLLLYNLSLTYERLNQYEKAIDALRGYMTSAPVGERATLRKKIASLRKLADKSRAERQPEAPPEKEREEEPEKLPEKEVEIEPPEVQPPPVPDPMPAVGTAEPMSPDLLAYVVMGAGGVVLITGGVLAVLALGARRNARDQCTKSGKKWLCPRAAEDELSQDRRLSLAADMSFGVGVAAVGAGTFMLLMSGDEVPAVEPAGVTLSPLPGGAALRFLSRF